jgi:hypothetical protein
MKQPTALAALIDEYFDGVLHTIDSGRWGSWVLDQERAACGQLVLIHSRTGYAVSLGLPGDWVAHVAEEDWATAEDVGQLLLATRDLEHARWLGLLPEPLPVRPPAVERLPVRQDRAVHAWAAAK